MSTINEYIDKCLAECPEGGEEILLGEIAKHLFRKYGPQERIEVRDRHGVAGYFTPAWAEIFDIELPPDIREKMLRETDPNEKSVSIEESEAWLDSLTEDRLQELVEESKRSGEMP